MDSDLRETHAFDEAISDADVRLAVRHPEPEIRAMATTRLGRQIRSAELTALDREKLDIILSVIAEDVASMVRRALAVTLRNSPDLPHKVAVKLIRDIDNIAVPILESSPVLTEEDLLDILRSKAAAKVLAVARRPNISGAIVRAVIRFGDSQAVANLAANDSAPLDQAAYDDMLRLARSDDLIEESLVKRQDLPPHIVEKLISFSSQRVASTLIERYDLNPSTAIDIATRTQERASIDFIEDSWSPKDLRVLTKSLLEEGRLTASLILRTACCGQMRFTEYALAARAGISPSKAGLMIHESGAFGMKALGARARLDALTTHILRGAAAIYKDLEHSGVAYDRAYFQRMMIERALSLPANFSDEDAEYLLEKLDALGDYSLEDMLA